MDYLFCDGRDDVIGEIYLFEEKTWISHSFGTTDS